MRFEKKVYCPNLNIAQALTIINLNKLLLKEIHYERTVNNIYLDSEDLYFYWQNKYGSPLRNKYRIRWYGNTQDRFENNFSQAKEFNLEIKSRNGNLGEKQVFPLIISNEYKKNLLNNFNSELSHLFKNSSLPFNILTKLNVLNPVLINTYTRRYFESIDKKFRVTLDYDLKFYKPGPTSVYNYQETNVFDGIILEIKYDSQYHIEVDAFLAGVGLRITKSSKYVMGIETLFF